MPAYTLLLFFPFPLFLGHAYQQRTRPQHFQIAYPRSLWSADFFRILVRVCKLCGVAPLPATLDENLGFTCLRLALSRHWLGTLEKHGYKRELGRGNGYLGRERNNTNTVGMEKGRGERNEEKNEKKKDQRVAKAICGLDLIQEYFLVRASMWADL